MKLLVVEDHRIVISGCRALFAEDAMVEMIEARTIAAARELIASQKPDVVVVDINLPDGSGLSLTRELISQDRHAKIVVFSMSDTPVLALQAIECGAKGYVSKNGDPMDLREAVFAVHAGGHWLPHDLVQEVALMRAGGTQNSVALSDRELLVLRELVHGRSMAEIASNIDVSYKTVANDCATLRSKLNARTNPEMVRIALELKLA